MRASRRRASASALSVVLGQQREECVEPFPRHRELRWKLPQEWPELIAQVEDAGSEEIGERLLDFVQAQQVRDVARALYREQEAGRGLAVPVVVVLRALQGVKRAVDFDRREMPAANSSSRRCAQSLRVQHAAPRLVAPARDTDANHERYANLSFFQPSSFRAAASASSSVRSRRSGVIETYCCSIAQRSVPSSVASTGTTVNQ